MTRAKRAQALNGTEGYEGTADVEQGRWDFDGFKL